VIDVHCHILPFLDDGALDWEAALSMARLMVEDGTRECITTPHWVGTPDETDATRARLEELAQRLRAAGIPLTLHPGNEVILVPRLVEALASGQALTLAGSRYLLLETAQLEHGAYVRSALFQLQSHGYRIILAHPERVTAWQGQYAELSELIERGCRLQVNAGSLLGEFGKGPRRAAEELVRRRWVSLLGSDAHSPSVRRPRLSAAAARCASLTSPGVARALVEDNPACILRDQELPYINTEAPAQRRAFALPWWRR
jgi:protein-tyrosine phosphatase